MIKNLVNNSIINIYKDENDRLYIDGKELYTKLTIGRDFPTWIRARIKSTNAIEGKDFDSYKVNSMNKGRKEIHYNIFIECAIAMLESMKKKDTECYKLLTMLSSLESNDVMATKHKKKVNKKKAENKVTRETCIYKAEDIEVAEGMKIFTESNGNFGNIRFVMMNNTPYAIANDILKALGYKEGNWRTTLKRKCRHVAKCNGLKINGGNVNLIPEGDIFRLMVGSKLPQAEEFERWIFDEVLPTLKKHGFYATNNTVEMMLNNPDMAIKMLENYKKEKEQKEALLKEKINNEPKVLAYEEFINSDGLYSFAETAKLLSIPRTATSKIFIGRNTLLLWLRRDGILIKSGDERNLPYQRYVNQNIFELKAIEDEDSKQNRITVKVTPKGIEYLYKKYRYSNMPKTINLDNYRNGDSLYEEEILEQAL